MTRILIVDDDPVQLRLMAALVVDSGFEPVTADGGDAALRLLRMDRAFGAVILDLVMPDRDGMAVMEMMRREEIVVPVIVQTAHSSPEAVASAMRQGAVDFFVKPVAPERLVVSLHNVLRVARLEALIRRRPVGGSDHAPTSSRSPLMHRVADLLGKAGRSALPVLIEGESGVGKQVLAREIHRRSDRALRPFVGFDCADHSAGSLETALFDVPDSAIRRADGGTLLLRNVGTLPERAQARLVVFLETGRLDAATGPRAERIEARIVATTSTRLLGLARAGKIRTDLFYRLGVLPIYVPPLRDRPEDIEQLASEFAVTIATELNRRVDRLSADALALLVAYDWPGNVRQLESTMFRAVALCSSPVLEPADFPQVLASLGRREEVLAAGSVSLSAPVHIDTAIVASHAADAPPSDRFVDAAGAIAPLAAVERDLIAFALARHGGHMSKVARALGIGRSTLYRKLREYGLAEEARTRAA